MKTSHSIVQVFILLAVLVTARASFVIPLTTAKNVQLSDAIFRGTVTAMSCYKDINGLIYTVTSLQVDEPLKGTFPPVVKVVHRGGQVGNEDEFCGSSPSFHIGGEYLLFLIRLPDGRLICTQGVPSAVPLGRIEEWNADGVLTMDFSTPDEKLLDEVRQLTENGTIPGADVTDQTGQHSGPFSKALTGMLGGTPSRFLQPDQGEPIPYLIDADSLPSGITLAQATNAVQQALNAWTAVTSLKFRLESIGGFGQGADTITNDDWKIRVQLHDNYNSINSPNVLGVGGRLGYTSPLSGVGWDIGGNVAGNEFRKSTRGYVVLEATNTALQTLSTLTETLCHELGHAINLAHSSEIVTNDPVLTDAMMYFMVHADGRGATLGSYDPPMIQQIYPSNTPPFTFARVMDITDASPQPNVSGINQIELRGYDLQTASSSLSFPLTNITANFGSFSATNLVLTFTPNVQGNGDRTDPANTGYYDYLYTRCSDGTNASPYVWIRTISLSYDSDATSDGIPNIWMNYHFGHSDPRAGDKSRAMDDKDADGMKNLNELRAGMNPTNRNSAQRILSLTNSTLQFQAKAFELYEVLGSTNLAGTNWTRIGIPIVPTNASYTIRTNLCATNIIVTVSNLPTTNPQMFYRILKVP